MRARSLTFVDGIDPITIDEKEATENDDSVNKHSRKCGMKINLDNTEVMTMGGTRKPDVDPDDK